MYNNSNKVPSFYFYTTLYILHCNYFFVTLYGSIQLLACLFVYLFSIFHLSPFSDIKFYKVSPVPSAMRHGVASLLPSSSPITHHFRHNDESRYLSYRICIPMNFVVLYHFPAFFQLLFGCLDVILHLVHLFHEGIETISIRIHIFSLFLKSWKKKKNMPMLKTPNVKSYIPNWLRIFNPSYEHTCS